MGINEDPGVSWHYGISGRTGFNRLSFVVSLMFRLDKDQRKVYDKVGKRNEN